MWVDERQQRIMDIIAATGRVEADAVAVQLRVSRETIRRDLMLLEGSWWGGAAGSAA
jgi:DeoR/GlpR family transcriptional regulator of sugar metabolism